MHQNDIINLITNNIVVLDKDLKFLFSPHNKNAQTSINRYLLKDRVCIEKDDPSYFLTLKKQFIKNIDVINPLTFTVVRNPLDRFVSAFVYLQKNKKIDKKIDINEWTNTVFVNTGTIFDPHFAPQEKYHKPIIDLNFDHIINFDNLNRDWRLVAKKISASENLPHKNAGRKRIMELSKKSRKIIEDIYYEDFEMFEGL